MKLYLTAALFFWLTLSSAQSQKGIWLTDIASEALDTDKGMDEVIWRCKQAGIDQIYVVVWNRGYTLYPSPLMEKTFGKAVAPRFKDRDILACLIEKAHASGLKVHAWFEFGFSCSYQEEDGGHLLSQKPHWAALDREGRLASKNGFQWMNAFHPEVQDFLIQLILEVVERYPVDGIQGDDRLPANPSLAGYDPYTVALYKESHQGAEPPADYKDPEWIQWRADILNNFMGRLHAAVQKASPSTEITMAPSPYPWSKEEYLQDWPVWVQNGWVDRIIPQIYRYDLDRYQATLKENLSLMPEDKKAMFIPGILLQVDEYNPDPEILRSMIRSNRELGLTDEVFFFYEGLRKMESFFNETYPKL